MRTLVPIAFAVGALAYWWRGTPRLYYRAWRFRNRNRHVVGDRFLDAIRWNFEGRR